MIYSKGDLSIIYNTKFNIRCPGCYGNNIIKKGQVKTKLDTKQIYLCKECGKRFHDRKMPNKTYGPRIIINAISCYNLGYTLDESSKLINRRFKVKVSKSSVHEWIREFKSICTYHKIRGNVLKDYGTEILVSKNFEHNGLNYNFKYHKAKLGILSSEFPGLIKYIKGLENGCPDFFSEDKRCSQLEISLKIKKEPLFNHACKLAGLALKSVKTNKERHSLVENFMLINDSVTIACEVPVWFWEKNMNLGICGHIDILQLRHGNIYILDFKPDAQKEDCRKVASQLYLYASGLSFRTNIPLREFRCAWFDDKVYYEFKPSAANVKF